MNSCPSPRGHRGPCALTADKAEPPPPCPSPPLRLRPSLPLSLPLQNMAAHAESSLQMLSVHIV